MREKGTGTIVMSNGRAQLLFKKTTGRTATITIKCKDGTTCGDKEEALKLVNEAFGELVSKTNGKFTEDEKIDFLREYFFGRVEYPPTFGMKQRIKKQIPDLKNTADRIQKNATLEDGAVVIEDFYGANIYRTKKTISVYNAFCRFAKSHYRITKVSQITPKMLEKFFEGETKRGLKKGTLLAYRTNIRRCMYALFKGGITAKYIPLPYKCQFADVEYIKVRNRAKKGIPAPPTPDSKIIIDDPLEGENFEEVKPTTVPTIPAEKSATEMHDEDVAGVGIISGTVEVSQKPPFPTEEYVEKKMKVVPASHTVEVPDYTTVRVPKKPSLLRRIWKCLWEEI